LAAGPVDLLLSLARTMAGPEVTAEQVEREAAEIPFVRDASAVFGGEAGVDYVELRLADDARIALRDLEARLGEAESVPRLHAGEPEQVALGLDEPGLPFRCTVFADLDEEGRVLAITLRRDERL
jgi:hypothetical protein